MNIQAVSSNASISVVAVALESEMRRRFTRIFDVSNATFDAIYALSSFLDPKYSASFDDDILSVIKIEIHNLVSAIRILCV